MFYKSAAHSCNGKINPMIYKPAARGEIFTFAETGLHIRQGWYILFMKIFSDELHLWMRVAPHCAWRVIL